MSTKGFSIVTETGEVRKLRTEKLLDIDTYT
jgi:hypothetical protein